MSKNSKKTDVDKLGEKRMKQFEERQKIKSANDSDEYYTVIAYQKIEPGEWERVELTYKRKKR